MKISEYEQVRFSESIIKIYGATAVKRQIDDILLDSYPFKPGYKLFVSLFDEKLVDDIIAGKLVPYSKILGEFHEASAYLQKIRAGKA